MNKEKISSIIKNIIGGENSKYNKSIPDTGSNVNKIKEGK